MSKINRRTLLSSASLAAFAASLPKTEWSGNPWAPTKLGVELMRRLWAFAEATYIRVNMVDASWHPDYDEAKITAAEEAEDETDALLDKMVDAILARPVTELAHLTDLALAHEAKDDGYAELATKALIEAILRFAGLPQSASTMDGVYEQVQRAHEHVTA